MRLFKNIFFRALIFSSLILLKPLNLLAQGSPDPSLQTTFPNPLKTNDLIGFIELIINNVVLPIGSVVVVFFIIFTGFLFVTAGGNEEKLKTAKSALLWTIVGAAILLGSWAISVAITNTIDAIKSDVSYYESSVSNV